MFTRNIDLSFWPLCNYRRYCCTQPLTGRKVHSIAILYARHTAYKRKTYIYKK